ncbi:MAG: PAC2 family protein [Candidatus Bathyarchaeia archaeon]
MSLRLEREPSGSNFKLVAAWPGMGMLATISADYHRKQLDAVYIGELETLHNSVTFKDGILALTTFKHKIYQADRILICIGESQPLSTPEVYDLAEQLIDFAKRYRVARVYTIAASLSPFTGEPKVFGVATSEKVVGELETYKVPPVMGEGKITGLNGVLLGVAAKNGLEGVCLLGQIRYVDIPQARTALNVLKYLVKMLDVTIDLRELEEEAAKIEASIQEAMRSFRPPSQERGLDYIG